MGRDSGEDTTCNAHVDTGHCAGFIASEWPSRIVQNGSVPVSDPLDRSHSSGRVLSALNVNCSCLHCRSSGELGSQLTQKSSPGSWKEQGDTCAWFQASPCPLSHLIPCCQCPSMGGGGPLVPPSQCDAGRGALRSVAALQAPTALPETAASHWALTGS